MAEQPEQTAPPNPSTITGLSHVSLSVSDLKASIAFYTEAASLEVDHSKRLGNSAAEKASGFVNSPVDRAVLAGPNGYLELSQYDVSLAGTAEEIPVWGPGVRHYCFQSPTPQDIYGRFKAQGATPVSRGKEPVSLMGRGVFYAYERDLDGIMFETEHLDKPHFEGPIWLSHIALVSHDLDRLADFYENLLGHKPNRRTNKAAGPRFDEVADYDDVHIRAAWFDMSNMVLELWQFVNPVTPEPGAPIPFEKIGYNKFAFEVSDIQSDYKRLLESGVEFLSEPVQTDESTEVFGRDPDGNLFSLIEPAPGSPIFIAALKARHS
jgi:catechol 2,3-dioxygenase-like lactoylglutathione lyase family enzyme